LLPSAKCTRPLFQGRTGCDGRPSGWHDIVTCQRLVFVSFTTVQTCFVCTCYLYSNNRIIYIACCFLCTFYYRYITMAFPLGNLAALRTFRVLRALKTVAVVPGKQCCAWHSLFSLSVGFSGKPNKSRLRLSQSEMASWNLKTNLQCYFRLIYAVKLDT